MEIKIKDSLTSSILAMEEAIWELEELIISHEDDFSEMEYSDIITAKELSQSVRDMCAMIMKQYATRIKKKD